MKRDKLRYRMKIYNVVSERKRGPGRPGQNDAGGPEDLEAVEAGENGQGPQDAPTDGLENLDLDSHAEPHLS